MRRIKCVDGLNYHQVAFRRDMWNLFRFDSSIFAPYVNTKSGYITSLHIDYDKCTYIITWVLGSATKPKQKSICYKDINQLSNLDVKIYEMISEFCRVNIRDEQIEQILN